MVDVCIADVFFVFESIHSEMSQQSKFLSTYVVVVVSPGFNFGGPSTIFFRWPKNKILQWCQWAFFHLEQ